MMWTFSVKLDVRGRENIPAHGRFCIASNHQTSLDFIAIAATFPKLMGFISKKELSYIPIVNIWMRIAHACVIDRDKKDEAVEIIKNRIDEIHKGYTLLIFPEGTRSRRLEMNKFKLRGLIAIMEGNVPILPITIVDSYQRFANGRIFRGTLKIIIHPLQETKNLSEEQQKVLFDKIETMMGEPLKELMG